MAGIILLGGCVKETYNLEKVSKKIQFSPSLAAPAFRGNVTFRDMVKPNDTVVFGNDNFVKLVFKRDSVINLALADFYDFADMVSYSHNYVVGNLSLAPFQGSAGFTLNEISLGFSSTLRNQFVSLDNGATHQFPSFPAITVEKAITAFPNFQNAVFASGFIDVTLTNNLTAPVGPIIINFYNTAGHTLAGGPLTIADVQPGQKSIASLDLTGLALTNSLTVSASLQSPGNTTPVIISLANSNIQFDVQGRNLKVRSGRVILPSQTISTIGTKDTLDFSPGQGVEIEKMKVNSGNLSWQIRSTTSLAASLNLTLPTALRNSSPVTESITVVPATQTNGIIQFSNTEVSLNTAVKQPFNRVPFEYGLTVTSNNSMVTFSSTDNVQLDMKLLNPDLDYVKGYFGQQTKEIENETVDFGMENFLKNLQGNFLVSSPSIKLNYSNSFAIPMVVAFNGQGRKGTQIVNLGLSPLTILFPAAPAVRDASSSFVIDKNNSSLPELISMPPEEMTFSGSAKMNPSGDPNHLRNNYVFGKSRFLGSVEVEVPLEFRLNNLQLTDTVDNFLREKDFGGFNNIKVKLNVKNGFPLGISLKMIAYNRKTGLKSTIDAPGILKPGPVDGNGKVNGVSDSETTLELTNDFLTFSKTADDMIISCTLVTTDNGSKDVKIYSDYRIEFNAAIIVKPEIDLK